MKHLQSKSWWFRAYGLSLLSFYPAIALVMVKNTPLVVLFIFTSFCLVITCLFRAELAVALSFHGIRKIFLFRSIGAFLIVVAIEMVRYNSELMLAVTLFVFLPFIGIMTLLLHRHPESRMLDEKLAFNNQHQPTAKGGG